MLEVLADEIFPAAAWSAERSSPVCRLRVELLDDSGRVIIRSSQVVTESTNTALSEGAQDARLDCPPAELLVGHNIGSVHATMVLRASDFIDANF